MKSTLLVATAVLAGFLSPAMAHHNSPQDVVLPDHALEVHNAAIEAMLDRLEAIQIQGNMNLNPDNANMELDPANALWQGNFINACEGLEVEECLPGPGGVGAFGAGSMQRGDIMRGED